MTKLVESDLTVDDGSILHVYDTGTGDRHGDRPASTPRSLTSADLTVRLLPPAIPMTSEGWVWTLAHRRLMVGVGTVRDAYPLARLGLWGGAVDRPTPRPPQLLSAELAAVSPLSRTVRSSLTDTSMRRGLARSATGSVTVSTPL